MAVRASRWKAIRRGVGQLSQRLGAGNRGSSVGAVARRWAGLASESFVRDLERVSWTGIPQVHLNHNFLITGNRDIYWIDWLRDRFFPDGGGDALSLGCGAGHLDRIFGQRGFRFRSVTGIDISPEAVDRARELGLAERLAPVVDYRAADLNRVDLPAAQFDFIYFFQSLHHIEALEHVLDQCRRALRPGGLLLVNEFVGPSRFQWTTRQIELATQALAGLPADLRRDHHHGGMKTAIERPTLAHMIRHDSSEAVRSAEIEPLLRQRFDVVGEWNWGGTLNHLVFQNIAGNFDPENADHAALVESLIDHENRVIRDGVLPSDFKVFVTKAP